MELHLFFCQPESLLQDLQSLRVINPAFAVVGSVTAALSERPHVQHDIGTVLMISGVYIQRRMVVQVWPQVG
jgi:hypothetical protein